MGTIQPQITGTIQLLVVVLDNIHQHIDVLDPGQIKTPNRLFKQCLAPRNMTLHFIKFLCGQTARLVQNPIRHRYFANIM